jgi:hypothetical protein
MCLCEKLDNTNLDEARLGWDLEMEVLLGY